MQITFGTGILYGVATADATGTAVANATPVQFGTLQDVSLDISFEEKLLYGAYQFPIAVGRGKGKVAGKAKAANIFGSLFSDLFIGTTSSAGIKAVSMNQSGSIPAVSTYTITPTVPSSGTWVSDLGVTYVSTGLPFKRVASAPTVGQYSVSAGVYTFAAADASQAVLISYEYSATSTAGPKSIALTNQLMGYAPTFKATLSAQFNGKPLAVVLNQCVSNKLGMALKNDDFMLPEFEFSAFADASNNIGYVAFSE